MAYKALIHLSPLRQKSIYADSILAAAKATGTPEAIGNAYLTKGIVHYNSMQLSEALHCYIKADSFLSDTTDRYAAFKLKYAIGQIQYYLGFYEEALLLLSECLSYFESENDRAYLNTLHSIALCYNKIGKYNSSAYYSTFGLAESIRLQNYEMQNYFTHSKAINLYGKREYAACIEQFKSVLPHIIRKKDYANEAIANFYIGKSYWACNRKDLAVPYLKKVDVAFVKKQYTRPDLREGIEMLVNYYKTRHNDAQLLKYVDHLLQFDRVLNAEYKYLSRTIHKQYETRQLLRQKSGIQSAMQTRSLMYAGSTAVLLILFAFFFERNRRIKMRYRKKFMQLMVGSSQPKKIYSPNLNAGNGLDISPQIVAAVLVKLEKFEQTKKYLDKNIGLVRIASYLGTNTKYASRIIAKYRDKKTIDYICDLKIEHAIGLITSQNRYRNYTNKALAEEVGFGSTQNFTKAFKLRTGISPTYFIENLKKNHQV